MGLGINTIALLEIRGQGVQWNNIDEPISLDDDFNLGWVFLMLILDSVVYMLIAWCVCCMSMYACMRTCMRVYMRVCTCVCTCLCMHVCGGVHTDQEFINAFHKNQKTLSELSTYSLIIMKSISMSSCRYVNGVKPGQYGVPKPFYFPFLPSYWTGKPFKSKKKDVSAAGIL